MTIRPLIWKAALHRSTYVNILKSYLRQHGNKGKFAEQVGITPQYLSYILTDDLEEEPSNQRSISRTPGQALCYRIASALDIPDEDKTVLLEHMLLSRQSLDEAVETVLPHGKEPEISLEVLDRLHQVPPDPQAHEHHYRVLHSYFLELLPRLDAQNQPLAYIRIALTLSGIENLIGRVGIGFYYARVARFVSEHIANPAPPWKEKSQQIRIESIRAQSTSYAHLNLFKQAQDCCQYAKRLVVPHSSEEIHLYGRHLKSLLGQPRFSIRAVEQLVREADRLCEGNPEHLLFPSFSVQHQLAQAYILHGNYRKAEHVINQKMSQLQAVRGSPLNQVQMLRTHAWLCWAQGDKQGWREYIQSAIELGQKTGLYDQVNKIYQSYGSALLALNEP